MPPREIAFDEVLKRLLPLCDGNVLAVADWLNDQVKLGHIELLGDGKPMHPNSVPVMLKVDGFVSPAGESYLVVQAPYAKVWNLGRYGFEAHCTGKGRRGRKRV